jgi:hypothetical protein
MKPRQVMNKLALVPDKKEPQRKTQVIVEKSVAA